MQRIVDPLIGPQRAHRDDAAVGLAEAAQPLAAHMRGGPPVLAIPAVIDHQHPIRMGCGRGLGQQQLQPTGIDPLGIPARLGQEILHPLRCRALGPGHRFGPGQRRSRLVPLPRRQ